MDKRLDSEVGIEEQLAAAQRQARVGRLKELRGGSALALGATSYGLACYAEDGWSALVLAVGLFLFALSAALFASTDAALTMEGED